MMTFRSSWLCRKTHPHLTNSRPDFPDFDRFELSEVATWKVWDRTLHIRNTRCTGRTRRVFHAQAFMKLNTIKIKKTHRILCLLMDAQRWLLGEVGEHLG